MPQLRTMFETFSYEERIKLIAQSKNEFGVIQENVFRKKVEYLFECKGRDSSVINSFFHNEEVKNI